MAIRVSPEELCQLAQKMDKTAEGLFNLATSLERDFDAYTAGFEGNAKERFAASFKEMEPTLKEKIPDLLKDFSKELKRKADDFDWIDKR